MKREDFLYILFSLVVTILVAIVVIYFRYKEITKDRKIKQQENYQQEMNWQRRSAHENFLMERGEKESALPQRLTRSMGAATINNGEQQEDERSSTDLKKQEDEKFFNKEILAKITASITKEEKIDLLKKFIDRYKICFYILKDDNTSKEINLRISYNATNGTRSFDAVINTQSEDASKTPGMHIVTQFDEILEKLGLLTNYKSTDVNGDIIEKEIIDRTPTTSEIIITNKDMELYGLLMTTINKASKDIKQINLTEEVLKICEIQIDSEESLKKEPSKDLGLLENLLRSGFFVRNDQ